MEDKYTFTEVRGNELVTVDMETGKVLSRNDDLLCVPKVKYMYSVEYGEAICDLIRQGKRLTELDSIKGVPPLNVIQGWKHRYPDFKKKLEEARVDSAVIYADKIAKLGDEAQKLDKDEVSANRLALDALKWAAEKADPSVYGNKVDVNNKHSGEVGFFVLNTGIKRNNLPEKSESDTIETTSTETEE